MHPLLRASVSHFSFHFSSRTACGWDSHRARGDNCSAPGSCCRQLAKVEEAGARPTGRDRVGLRENLS